METKTELDQKFDYPDDPRVVQYHNEMFLMSFCFSVPLLGWAALGLVILRDWLWKKLRLVRLYLLIVWHEFF